MKPTKLHPEKPNEAALGNCYHTAWMMLFGEMPGVYCQQNSVLCHGVVTQTQPPHQRMGHAWIEETFEPFTQHPNEQITVVRDGLWPLKLINKRVYYALGQVEEETVRRYTREQALLLAADRDGLTGPWDELIASLSVEVKG